MDEDDMTYDDILDAGYAIPEEEVDTNPGEGNEGPDEGSENPEGNGSEGEEQEEQEDQEDQSGNANGKKSKNSQRNKLNEAFYKKQLQYIYAAHKGFGGYKQSTGEKRIIARASVYERLQKWIKKIKDVLNINRIKAWWARIRRFAAGLGTSGVVGIILLVVICLVCMIIFSSDSGKTVMGVKGKDFYGCRLVYENEERARNDLANDYLEMINKSISAVEKVDSTLEINIEMPPEEYEMDCSTFEDEYPTLGGAVLSVAQIVSEFDNSQASSSTDLSTCLGEIKYFGLPDDENTTSNIALAIADFIIETEDLNIEASSISSHISAVVEKYQTRTEKLYIKDYILESEDEMMSAVAEESYVAFMFMPKTGVTFSNITFQIMGEDLTGVSLKLYNGETRLVFSIDKELSEASAAEKEKKVYITDNRIAPGVFQDIDTNNLTALSEGVSLLDIVKNEELSNDTYLSANAENSNLLTFKRGGVRIEVAYEDESVERRPCILNEFRTEWFA